MDININDIKQGDRGMIFHLIIIIVYTFFALVLSAETVLMEWELWVIPVLFCTVIAVWWIYVKQPLKPKVRLIIYLIMMLFALFYYGIHPTSLFDVPLLLLVSLMLFTLVDEDFITFYFYADYALIIVWHIFVTGAVGEGFTVLEWSRLFMNFAVIVIAGMLFRYTIHSRRRDRMTYLDVIRLMEDTNKRSEDFLTNVSHELRTPINAVTGITAVMQETEEDKEKRANLSSVQRAGRRLSDQIGDILDYTEIDTGRIRISRSPYMISSLIYDLAAELDFMWNDSGNELIMDIDPNLPAGLTGDAAKISRIIRHLADNALKFTKDGGVYVRAYGLKREYGINLCIQVRDTGIGISREQLERLTDHFYQADAGRARRVGGIGLGLAVVQGLVMSMDGFMHIDSDVGEGTTVHVSIPQGVEDPKPCMSVENADEICVGCFLYPDRYPVPAVRDYYNEMIRHLGDGLGVRVHYCISAEELEKVMEKYRLTHLFLGREEYDECRGILEKAGRSVRVAVSLGRTDKPVNDSAVKILKKPFTVFSILQILNEREDRSLKEESRPYLPGIRALVVDDDGMNLIVAKGILGMYGMKVDTAGGGQESVDMCLKKDYDIVFMDHMMPEMDGIEAMHRIRKIVKPEDNPYIVALTANAVSGAREMFLQEGFDEFIAKPIVPLILERSLRKLLPPSAFEERKEEETDMPDKDKAGEKESAEDMVRKTADPIDRLDKDGFDIKQALIYCGNDEGFYLEMLRTFTEEAPDKRAALQKSYEAADYDNYRISVHSLKSGSRTIGAIQLSEEARLLEEAAKTSDSAYILSKHDEMMKRYAAVAEQIKEALPEAKSGTKEEDKAGDDRWGELLKRLKQAVDDFDSDAAEKVMAETKSVSYEGRAAEEILAEVFAAVKDYDFMAAAAALETVMEDRA